MIGLILEIVVGIFTTPLFVAAMLGIAAWYLIIYSLT